MEGKHMPSPKRKYDAAAVQRRFQEKSKLSRIVNDPAFQVAATEWSAKAGLLPGADGWSPEDIAIVALRQGFIPPYLAQAAKTSGMHPATLLMANYQDAKQSGDPERIGDAEEMLSRAGIVHQDGSTPGSRFMQTAVHFSDPEAMTERRKVGESPDHFDENPALPRTQEGFIQGLAQATANIGVPLPEKMLGEALAAIRQADLEDTMLARGIAAEEEARANEPPSYLENLETDLAQARKDAGGGSVEGMAKVHELENRVEEERRNVTDREQEAQGKSASRAALEAAFDAEMDKLQPTKSKLRKELEGLLAAGDIDYPSAYALNTFLEETSTETRGISEETDEGKFRLMEAWKREEERAAIAQGELPPLRTEVVIPDFETREQRAVRERARTQDPESYGDLMRTERLRGESDREGRAQALSDAWDVQALAHGEPTMSGQTPGSEPDPTPEVQAAGSDDIRSHLEAAYDRAFGSEE
jgi:hypothetical protein